MTQTERRLWLINYLLSEQPEYRKLEIPEDAAEQFKLYRALVNVRMPAPVSEEFLKIEDEFLSVEAAEKGVTTLSELTPLQKGIYLWQGDITTLQCDAIVNAANAKLLGCFVPCHACIDNCIHTFSGVRLRQKCKELMERQGYDEPTGKAKITPAYNLPSCYVIHTVGPIVRGRLTEKEEALLVSSYRECLRLAEENGLKSIAFCCISTGVFGFPQKRAAALAVQTVREYKKHSDIEVVFNVFKDEDKRLYEALLK